MNTRRLLATALLLFCGLAVGQEQVQIQKWTARVRLIVEGDEPAATSMRSYVNREFRAIGDVVVTDHDPNYRVSIVIRNVTRGYAISVVTCDETSIDTARVMIDAFNDAAGLNIKGEAAATLIFWMGDRYANVHHWLKICLSSELEAAIKEFVAKFDVESLQPVRDGLQKYSDSQKKKN